MSRGRLQQRLDTKKTGRDRERRKENCTLQNESLLTSLKETLLQFYYHILWSCSKNEVLKKQLGWEHEFCSCIFLALHLPCQWADERPCAVMVTHSSLRVLQSSKNKLWMGHGGTHLQKIKNILIFRLLPYPGSWIREDTEAFWKWCLLTSAKSAVLGVQCVQVPHGFSSSCPA